MVTHRGQSVRRSTRVRKIVLPTNPCGPIQGFGVFAGEETGNTYYRMLGSGLTIGSSRGWSGPVIREHIQSQDASQIPELRESQSSQVIIHENET
ncbi:hypothetical protein Cni_G03303 [Canna indica]|uniref:Uncharacterized protein n=1 Tax=Canna indica TaxID=4628 RepID=A0AAQ3Q1K4_9LILI|nr:hypothetical protein Cni_G03303 [Canna indica]